MSQPAIAALAPLPEDILLEDGEPLESQWHWLELPLFAEVIHQAMAEQGRTDYHVGANNFVYYSYQQVYDVQDEVARDVPDAEKRAFRGPDVFWVGGVARGPREAWVAWHEGGRLPDVIVEMLSPSTADKDRHEKKDLYAQVFGTAEYFLCEPGTWKLEGYRLAGRSYRPIRPDAHGRLWSEQLGAALGLWHGEVQDRTNNWFRLFHADGSLVLTKEEAARQQAEEQRQRAEAERRNAEVERQKAAVANQRAEAAEAELARLRARLEKL